MSIENREQIENDGNMQASNQTPESSSHEEINNNAAVPPFAKKPDRTNEYVLLAVVATIIIAIGIIIVFFGARFISEIREDGGFKFPFFQGGERHVESKRDEGNDSFDWDEDDDEFGLDSIEPFVDQNLPYSVESDFWELMESADEGETFFYIQYPVINGLSNTSIQNSINKEIEDTAMRSRDLMYPSPIPAIQNIVDEGDFLLESTVDYKVAYMDENIISIVFEDYYFLGSIFAEYCDMRTVTFDLKTGTLIQEDAILNISEDFLIGFRERLIMEDTSSSVFSDTEVLSDENLTKILNGEIFDGRYSRIFFPSAKGIDIGICYHYRSSDSNIIARGYTTASYTFDEIKPYITSHPMWDVIKNS